MRNLTKTYLNFTRGLHGISFSLDEREFALITGRSICGETTLLNILGGLDRSTSGEVIIAGERITDRTEDRLARLRLE